MTTQEKRVRSLLVLPRRRQLLIAASLAAAGLPALGKEPAFVKAVRLWPGSDYSRLTLELSASISYSQFMLDKPDRLVVDLEDTGLTPALEKLQGLVSADDRYVRQIRVARNRPGVIRLVIELREPCTQQVFELAPAAGYGPRLVIDAYPKADPMAAFLAQQASVPQDAPASTATEALDSETVPIPSELKGRKTRLTIALDPGHGGEDPGAVGRGGSHEKNVVLAIAHRLQKKLDDTGYFRTMLTRDRDYFVPLHDRVTKARRAKADVFLSIHADAWTDPAARGSSVFVLSDKGASSAQARILAQHENDADLVGGVNLKRSKDPFLAKTLLDLSQTATNADSLKLGNRLIKELGALNALHRGQVEQAGFAVLKAPDIPSALVETAFISNPEEEKKLNDDRFQDKLAGVLARGIASFASRSANATKMTP